MIFSISIKTRVADLRRKSETTNASKSGRSVEFAEGRSTSHSGMRSVTSWTNMCRVIATVLFSGDEVRPPLARDYSAT